MLAHGDPPPGIYVWADPHGAVLYIGRAVDLAHRLSQELGWIHGYEPLGGSWEVSVVHLLTVHQAQPRWARACSSDAAETAERRLIEWHRARRYFGDGSSLPELQRTVATPHQEALA